MTVVCIGAFACTIGQIAADSPIDECDFPMISTLETSSVNAAQHSNSWLEVVGSRYFLDWLAEENISLGFSTYQTGKLLFLGRKPNHHLGVFERTFPHCMGLWASPDSHHIWLSTRYQMWRLDNVSAQSTPSSENQTSGPGINESGANKSGINEFDAVYVPRVGHTTGHLDIHDVAVEQDGRVVFVNTMFGCLATLSDRASFQPLWRPPFLSATVPEDRCHLNGVAIRDGRVRYVTAAAACDVAEGWRDHRSDGGCVIDVRSGDVLATGLSMPHSPRWYQDKLWVLNSGAGEFGYIDQQTGQFQSVAFIPGYLRGLAFRGNYAIVTSSLPRHGTFDGLPLDGQLEQRNATPQCGLHVIDLRTGHVAHNVRLNSKLLTELYDVVVLPGVTRPKAVGFKSNEIERVVLVDEPGEL